MKQNWLNIIGAGSIAASRGRKLALAFVGIVFSFSAASVALADTQQLTFNSSEFKTPLVELYTSEGCSSCPPADEWLRKFGQSLQHDFNAVPLAFHVDYWNYLGWKDAFSKASYTERQRQVAINNRQRNIYTPEFVVDGREARGGKGIIQSIQDANSQPAEADIEVSVMREDLNNIAARINIENRAKSANVHVAVFESGIIREIGAGENHGKTLLHDFVVRHWSAPISIDRGDNSADVTVEIPDDWQRSNLGLAVVVLDRNNGETVQAVKRSLASLFSG